MNAKDQKELSHMIQAKENRKIKEKQKSKHGFWYGLGMFGLVGWSVVVPTLLGAMLGRWMDRQMEGTQSWTLTFLLAGLIFGCWIAWLWLSKEDKEINKEEDKNE
jgi:ATP synthase protein I